MTLNNWQIKQDPEDNYVDTNPGKIYFGLSSRRSMHSGYLIFIFLATCTTNVVGGLTKEISGVENYITASKHLLQLWTEIVTTDAYI